MNETHALPEFFHDFSGARTSLTPTETKLPKSDWEFSLSKKPTAMSSIKQNNYPYG